MTPDRIRQLRDLCRSHLLDDIMAFWQKHGVDRECGGFLTCLDRDGSAYSTDKPVWVMGRATWTYAALHRLAEPREEWLQLARHGYEFMNRCCFAPNGKMYFSVTRDGRPLQMRRYAFSEVFAALGMSALAAITGDEAIRLRAIDVFGSMKRYFETPGLIAPKLNPETRPMKSLSPRMCMISVADAIQLIDNDPIYERSIDACIQEVFHDFVKPDDAVLLETVAPSGERIDSPQGRCMNPGHSIEIAWFILEVARRRNDAELASRALSIIDWAFERGWDREYGGLLYFVDVEGKPSHYIEHDMKLWWPHSEALYATLLAYRMTGDERYAFMFEKVHDWTFAHFPDRDYGEWFGYLRRDGQPSSLLKGNMWKGPFHIPRALVLCWKLLEEMSGAT